MVLTLLTILATLIRLLPKWYVWSWGATGGRGDNCLLDTLNKLGAVQVQV
jgi:hypothetical protein